MASEACITASNLYFDETDSLVGSTWSSEERQEAYQDEPLSPACSLLGKFFFHLFYWIKNLQV